ncbi:MAG: orotate phosphoribosyltransferase [Candidatus Omnitrophica bacterium]|nr:orotate phosphoribosyltransferase [Candidatus Omnitrophota bacterium]
MNKKNILNIFNKTNALLTGHFKLSSGLHSEKYLQCALVLQYPKYAKLLCSELAKKFEKEKPTVVAGPALGGIIVSYEVARALKCRSIFAEREEGRLTFRRNFSVDKSDRVLVVEDVVTTGLSTKELITLIKDAGTKLVGVGSIVDRSNSKIDFGARFKSLIKIKIDTYSENNCPLCKQDIPLVKPGSRK